MVLASSMVWNPLPADSFSKYKAKVIPNKVCIKCTDFTQLNTVYFESFDSSSAEILQVMIKYEILQVMISAEDESNDSKYTVFNCVKSHYAHFIRNYFSLIFNGMAFEKIWR